MFCRRKKHNSGRLRDSTILKMLEEHSFNPYGEPMSLCGDPAHPPKIHLQSPFRVAVPNSGQVEFNKSMSLLRVSVE